MTASIAVAGFIITGLLGAYRIVLGPGLADRVIALDVMVMALMGAITVDAANRRDPDNLIVLVVLAIVGFTATVAATRFLELERGQQRQQNGGPES